VAYFIDLAVSGMLFGGLYALVAMGIVLVFKATHVISLAHGQLLAFGALFFWLPFVGLGLPLWLSLLLCLVLSALLGLVVERFTLRPLIGQPLFSAFLMTFAIFFVLDGIFQLILKGQSWTYPAFLPKGTINIGGINLSVADLVSFAIALVIFFLILVIFQYTRIGLGMRATAEEHQLAQSVGINVRTIFSMVWLLSAVAAAFAGIAIARVMDIYYPLPWIAVKGLIVAIVGGLDSIPGAFVAGLLLGFLENVAAGYLDPIVGGGIKDVAAYVLLLFILVVKPYGLLGLVRIERI